MATLGIDPSRVYADDGAGNPAFWTVFPGGTHGHVVAALKADPTVEAAVKAKFAAPNDTAKRKFVIDHLNRATANCLGQHVAGRPLQPENADSSLYKLLATGTAAAIDTVLSDPANAPLHTAFANQDADGPHGVIATISRQVGRALFQTCLTQIENINPGNIVNNLKSGLLQAAARVVPGV